MASISFIFLTLFSCVFLFISSSYYDGWEDLPYCTSKEQIPKTEIQPLSENQQLHHLELQQVHVLARHGARTPYTAHMSCWEVTPNPLYVPWNCSYLSINSFDIDPITSKYGRLYHQIFNSGENELNGTCKLGALLPFGTYQHHENGKLLQKAYIGDGKLKLFPTNDMSKIQPEEIYLRSDDLERTIASGHALVNGLFPLKDENRSTLVPQKEMFAWHLSDFNMDILYPNPRLCPLLKDLSDAAISSSEFYHYSLESLPLQEKLTPILGDFVWEELYECAALARCNDIPLPQGMTEPLFNEILNNSQHRAYLQLTYDDAFYSKLSMAPLFNVIFDDGLLPMAQGKEGTPKLKIYMVHDSTHMALLAALLGKTWDGMWSTYASLFIIELYKINQLNTTEARFYKNETHALRFLYKGKPLHIPGCYDELCGLNQIEKILSYRHPLSHCDEVTADTRKGHLLGTAPPEHHASFWTIILYLALVGVGILIVYVVVKMATTRPIGEGEREPLVS